MGLGKKSPKFVSHNQLSKNQGIVINGTNDKVPRNLQGIYHIHCTEVGFTSFLSLEFTIEVY